MLNKLGPLALLVYALAVVGAVIAPRPAPPNRDHAPLPRPLEPGQRIVGFTINFHHGEQLAMALQAVDDLAALGVNSVQVITPVYQLNGASPTIDVAHPGSTPGGASGISPSREQLLALLRRARQRGLRTALMPVVLFARPRGNEWRGKIHPEAWAPWWQSYEKIIDGFLSIAVEADADAFCVGSELLSTERQTEPWLRIIAHARQQFRGRLYYSTNWDHYDAPTFWDRLDMIGVNGYFDLTEGAGSDQPSPQALAQRWGALQKKLLTFAAHHDRSLLFTELGYPSLPTALKHPWNYFNDAKLPADHAAQARGYAAFLEAWGDLLDKPADADHFAGVFFYEWDAQHHGGQGDTGYGVRGKPAFDLLHGWLQQHNAQP